MNIADAKKVLTAAYLADDTVLMDGVHGIGKSSIVAEYSKENNLEFVPLFLSHQEVGDLIGMPRTIQYGTEIVTTWTQPVWLARMINAAWPIETDPSNITFHDEELEKAIRSECDNIGNREALNAAYTKVKGLTPGKLHLVSRQSDISCAVSRGAMLFLDELNRAPIDVRQSALQLVLEKQVHEHELPYVNGKATQIVAAINPADEYQVEELDPALLDRFLTIEVEADYKAFLSWGREKGLNPVVLSFIAENPKMIHFTPEDGSKGATPRSWAKLSSFVDVMDRIPGEIQFQVLKGKIGSALGSRFLTYYSSYSKTLKIEDIEKVIAKEQKKNKTIEQVGEAVAKLIKDQEVIQKTEMAENFFDKYIDSKKSEDAYPLLAYLYGLELELRASFIKQKKENDMKTYTKFVGFDKDLNNKQLFISIINTIK